MKQIPALFFLICCLMVAGTVYGEGQDPFAGGLSAGESAADEASHREDPLKETSSSPSVADAGFLQQISYSLGYDIVSHIRGQVDLDMDYFLKGAADAQGGSPSLSRDQMKEMLMAYQRLARQKAREAVQKIVDENTARGRVFMEGNKIMEGVVTLSSGLQYKVIKEGEGPVPKEESTVECHYRGTLLDGTEFDSSYTRGRPAVFQVDKVIKGWSQALMRMPVGSRWMLYIPHDLAYGDKGAGDAIQPGQTLIFEVELLGILD